MNADDATPEPAEPDKVFSWDRIWTKLFVGVVCLVLAVEALTFLQFRAEVKERERAVCETRNEVVARQRELWEFIIQLFELSAEREDELGRPERVERLRIFLDETFRTLDCG